MPPLIRARFSPIACSTCPTPPQLTRRAMDLAPWIDDAGTNASTPEGDGRLFRVIVGRVGVRCCS
jgi:hypothetical protein